MDSFVTPPTNGVKIGHSWYSNYMVNLSRVSAVGKTEKQITAFGGRSFYVPVIEFIFGGSVKEWYFGGVTLMGEWDESAWERRDEAFDKLFTK